MTRPALSLLLAALFCLLATPPALAFDLGLDIGGVNVDSVGEVFSDARTVVEGEEFTPEQEHYIGRSVAANILADYPALEDPALTAYLNRLGQTLAAGSDRPETFGGYHFLALDTEEINAFATPGGFIFVTRGMLGCCRSEDALAAVLAHEISHVTLAHGIESIETSRVTQAATNLAMIGADAMTGGQLSEMTDLFADSLKDITRTLVVNGYSVDAEYEADAKAIELLGRMGYDPAALKDMLLAMDQRLEPDGPGFGRTHPDPTERIEHLPPLEATAAEPPPSRQARFQAALGAL